MVVTRLGKRYAKSLLDLSREMGKLEEVKGDIEKIIATISSSREFRILIQSPVVKPDKKISILREIFSNEIDKLTMSFLEIITRKGRESQLESVARGFMELYRVHKGIARAVVTTAVPLNDNEREEIRRRLVTATGKEIDIEEKVDPSIIGGMTLRVENKQYNGSIAHQLETLKRQFKNNLYVPEF